VAEGRLRRPETGVCCTPKGGGRTHVRRCADRGMGEGRLVQQTPCVLMTSSAFISGCARALVERCEDRGYDGVRLVQMD
jgi:hypothetical protein